MTAQEHVEQVFKSLEVVFGQNLGEFSRQRSRHLTLGLVVLKYNLDNNLVLAAGLDWPTVKEVGPQPIGVVVDGLISKVETEIPMLRGLFPLGYGCDLVNQFHLGLTLAKLARIELRNPSPGDFDLVGQMYERLLVADQLRSTERSAEDIRQMLDGFFVRYPRIE